MAATERIFVATPTPTLGRRAIAAPVEFYTTGEDNLRIISVNSQTGVSLKVNARLVTIDGTIDSASWDHTPNANRTTQTTDFPLAPGAVLNLVVFANAGAPLIGQTFVIAQLIRGMGSAAVVLGVLFSGYVTASQCLAWPGSPIVTSTEGEPVVRNIVGTTPAAGGGTLETCPAGARWELVSVFASLTTSVVAGTRNVFFRAATPTVFTAWIVGAGNQAANVVGEYTFGQNMTSTGDLADGVYAGQTPLGLRLLAGDAFTINGFGLLAGDRFSAPHYQVREWLEVG